MKKTIKQIEDKTVAVLQKEIADLRKEIGKMTLEARTNPQKDTNTLMKKRRTLAVMLTALTGKQLLEKAKTLKN